MYFGSVRFFKHLIVAVFIIVFLLPLVLSAVFGIQLSMTRGQLKQAQAVIETEDQAAAPVINPAVTGEPISSVTTAPADDGEKDRQIESLESELDALRLELEQALFRQQDYAVSQAEAEQYAKALETRIDELIQGWDSELTEEVQRYVTALNSLVQGETGLMEQLLLEKGVSPMVLANAISSGGMGVVETYLEVVSLTPETMSYTKEYPKLYVQEPTVAEKLPGMVYLTFDDGPAGNTEQLLDSLQARGIKATFFVCPAADGSDAALLKRIVDEGHAIGVHSSSHDYETIYASVEAFLGDFSRAFNDIYEATGVYPKIYRFPGGSVNAANRLIYKSLIAEMTRRGFTYYDWSVDGADLSTSATPSTVYNTVMAGMEGKERAIIQLHCGISSTAEALDGMIASILERGYAFDKLENTVMPVAFGYTPD